METSSSYLLDTKKSAADIGFSPSSLKNSRFTGTLAGVAAPEYIKIGRKVFYTKEVLDVWKGQFKKFKCTSEYKKTP